MSDPQLIDFSFLFTRESKTPVFTMFHLDPSVYDEICTLAFHENQGICQTMQDFMERGLRSLKHVDPDYNFVPLSGVFDDVQP